MLCVKPIFWKPKMLVCTLVGEWEGFEKVYCLYTHENVDIFGWPLSSIINFTGPLKSSSYLATDYISTMFALYVT